MTTQAPVQFEQMIRDVGEGWLLDFFTTPQQSIPHLKRILEATRQHGAEKLGGNAPDISPEGLIAEFRANPTKVKAFLQVLRGSKSPDMLLMAWRIMQGMEIQELEITYQHQQSFQAQVVLQSPYGGDREKYLSTNIQDFSLFRHFGILEINGRPVLDGFYALNVQE